MKGSSFIIGLLFYLLQVEENKVESIRKDKAATEKLLQESIEKHQAELTTQKEYYTHALSAAKEAEALAEARANNEARTELEGRLREAEERESMLVQALEELRQTLSRKEQQVSFLEHCPTGGFYYLLCNIFFLCRLLLGKICCTKTLRIFRKDIK